MDNEPLISVIVPVYNVEKYLKKCVDSICAQSYLNLEIILIDDGSTDASGKMCDEFSKEDSRVLVIHKENGGQASARNQGLDLAKGEYISFIDSDDFVGDDFIMSLYNSLVKQGSDLDICGYTICDEKGIKLQKLHTDTNRCISVPQFWDDVILGKEILYGAVEPPLKLYKSGLFNGLRFREMRIVEDEEILYDLIKRCERISINPYCDYYYVQRVESTMHRKYSIDRMAASAVFIERSEKFFEDGYQEYAECTLMTAADKIMEGIKSIPNGTGDKKKTMRNLIREYGKIGKKLRKNTRSFKFFIKSIIFTISPRVYGILSCHN